jgi:NAD(P)-dependent dehydrogenase (short-subunit alcohol dehydrogenase family)
LWHERVILFALAGVGKRVDGGSNENREDLMKLEGSVAMVTGAASGIGRATATLFAAEGARLVLTDIDEAGLASHTATLHDHEIWSRPADVARASDVESLVGAALERFGRIDILCNIAGRSGFGDVLTTTEEAWDDIMATNLKSVFLCSRAVLPGMIERKRGSIVNAGSVWGVAAGGLAAAYCASKGGIMSLTRSMAVDYARYGIRVNALCPGGVETPMLDRYADALPNVSPTAARNILKAAHPLGRLAEPMEIARAALFLACDDSSFVTGSNLVVDGGFLAR